MDSVSISDVRCEVTQNSRTTEKMMIPALIMICIQANSSVSSLLCECRACTSVSATEIKSCAGTAVKVSMKITDMIIREPELKPWSMTALPLSTVLEDDLKSTKKKKDV